MAPIKTIALVSPARTSGGGAAFPKNLETSLGKLPGIEVLRAELPPRGSISLPQSVKNADLVVFLGTRASKTNARLSILWPLNVAPLDYSVDRLPHTKLRNRVRNVALRTRLSKSISKVDALCFGSNYARSLYMAKFPQSARLPYKVIPGGTPSIPIESGRQTQTRQQALLLCCSHLYPYKGILELVQAVAVARPKLPDSLKIRIAGGDRDANYAAAVREMISHNSLDEMISISQATPEELVELYQSATAAVFPSLCENAGSFALFDGLHYGVPTVCSDRSSMPEMVSNSTLLVNPAQSDRFAEAITAIITDERINAHYKTRAESWAASAPSWDDRAAALLDFANTELGIAE